jgi:hypothetical protein
MENQDGGVAEAVVVVVVVMGVCLGSCALMVGCLTVGTILGGGDKILPKFGHQCQNCFDANNKKHGK